MRTPTFVILGLLALSARAHPEPTSNLVEVATNNGLTTLVSLVGAAGLADAIANTQNLTIFAPSNAAFDKLPEETLAALAADPELLASVLTYHVVPDVIKRETLERLRTPKLLLNTLADIPLKLTSCADTMRRYGMARHVKVNGLKLGQNYMATNGIIHVIDDVLIPPTKNLLEMVEEDPELSTFLAAIQTAGLENRLTMRPASTSVYAPTNAAFGALPAGTVEGLLADVPALTNLLELHLQDNSGMFKKPGPLPINHHARVKRGHHGSWTPKPQGIKATNGYLYKIDYVIM